MISLSKFLSASSSTPNVLPPLPPQLPSKPPLRSTLSTHLDDDDVVESADLSHLSRAAGPKKKKRNQKPKKMASHKFESDPCVNATNASHQQQQQQQQQSSVSQKTSSAYVAPWKEMHKKNFAGDSWDIFDKPNNEASLIGAAMKNQNKNKFFGKHSKMKMQPETLMVNMVAEQHSNPLFQQRPKVPAKQKGSVASGKIFVTKPKVLNQQPVFLPYHRNKEPKILSSGGKQEVSIDLDNLSDSAPSSDEETPSEPQPVEIVVPSAPDHYYENMINDLNDSFSAPAVPNKPCTITTKRDRPVLDAPTNNTNPWVVSLSEDVVLVVAKANFPPDRFMGLQMFRETLELVGVNQGCWAEVNTQLADFCTRTPEAPLGWRLVKINSQVVRNAAERNAVIRSLRPGEKMSFTLDRRPGKPVVQKSETIEKPKSGTMSFFCKNKKQNKPDISC